MFEWLKNLTSNGSDRSPGNDFWYQPTGVRTAAGMRVSHDNALQVAAVLACIKVLAETEASLPLHLYKREGSGDKTRLSEHPLSMLLAEQPNSEHTALEFREMLMAWTASRGWAVAEIVPGKYGPVSELIPIHPDYVRAIKGDGRNQWFIEVNEPDSTTTVRPREDYFLMRAMAIKPGSIEGLDPITVESQTIGAAMAAQDYAARFFANDAQQGGILKHPGNFKDQEARDRFRRGWDSASTGGRRHGTRVLEYGIDFASTSITNEQAQFLETRKYHDSDIARIFRIPAHKIGIMDKATFSNIEQQAIEFVTDTMLPWLVRFEQAVKRDLIISQPGVFVEHNVAGLLRGDIKSRYEAYAIGRNWGWLSANDVRRLENANSLGTKGDHYLTPMNMAPAGSSLDKPQAHHANPTDTIEAEECLTH